MAESKISGCPQCFSRSVRHCKAVVYSSLWACRQCGHEFKRHVLWRPLPPSSTGNVVKLVQPDPPKSEDPLTYQAGPMTVLEDITAYEAAVLGMLVIRSLGQDPMYVSDLLVYDLRVLRHILVKNEDGLFIRGDKFLTKVAEHGSS